MQLSQWRRHTRGTHREALDQAWQTRRWCHFPRSNVCQPGGLLQFPWKMTSVSLTWTEKTKEEQNAKEGLSFQLITESNVQCSTEILTTLLCNHIQIVYKHHDILTENVVEERKLSGQFDLSNNIFILSNIRTENFQLWQLKCCFRQVCSALEHLTKLQVFK